MKKLLLGTIVLLSIGAGCNNTKGTLSAADDGNDNELTVAFYNVENLFDTVDDPNTFDEEFTPEGKKEWTEERYQDKLGKLSSVIAQLDAELPEMVGFCEVENEQVVRDLIATKNLKAGKYAIVHKDSPDGRGIDCALIYRPEKVELIGTDFFTAKLPAGDRPNTRLVLYAKMKKANDTLHVFVNHWPSRGGGQAETEPNRLTIAGLVKERVLEIQQQNPDAKILLMGDFNDYPNDKSIREILQASGRPDWPMFNFMDKMNKEGEGTYNYKGVWGTLDQFISSSSLVESSSGIYAEKDAARIFREDFILYFDKEGKPSPSRTYGREYYGGYSDHLPILLQLKVN